MTGALDSHAQGSLVFGADPGAAARLNLGPVGNEPPDLLDVLVVNELDVLDAEGANPAPRHKPSAGAPPRTSSRPAASRASGRASAWPSWGTSPLWSIRRPVRGFGCHTFRFLLRFPVVLITRLEGQIVGFVVWWLVASALTAAVAATVAVTTASTTVFVVSPASQHLHFSERDVQRVARLAIPIRIAASPQTALNIDLLTPGQILVANICKATECAAPEPFGLFTLFAVCRPVATVGSNVE